MESNTPPPFHPLPPLYRQPPPIWLTPHYHKILILPVMIFQKSQPLINRGGFTLAVLVRVDICVGRVAILKVWHPLSWQKSLEL